MEYLYFSFGISSPISSHDFGEYYISLDAASKTLAFDLTTATPTHDVTPDTFSTLFTNQFSTPTDISTYRKAEDDPEAVFTVNIWHSTLPKMDVVYVLLTFSLSLVLSIGMTVYLIVHEIKKRQRKVRLEGSFE